MPIWCILHNELVQHEILIGLLYFHLPINPLRLGCLTERSVFILVVYENFSPADYKMRTVASIGIYPPISVLHTLRNKGIYFDGLCW